MTNTTPKLNLIVSLLFALAIFPLPLGAVQGQRRLDKNAVRNNVHPAAIKTNRATVEDFGCMPFVHAPVDPSPMDCFTRLEANDDQSDLGNRTPLILIHGIHGSAANVQQSVSSIYFSNLIAFLNSNANFRQRFKIYRFHYRSDYQPVYEIARSLRNRIDDLVQTERMFDDKKFVIIAHSMGGLVARSYMNQHDTDFGEPFRGRRAGERISKLITLGTPHHGSVSASGTARWFSDPDWKPAFEFADFYYWTVQNHCGFCGVDPSAPNRGDLRFDNFNGLWNGNLSYLNPLNANFEKNLWLQQLPTTYDRLISAYYGYIGGGDAVAAVGALSAFELGEYLRINQGNDPGIQIGSGVILEKIESNQLSQPVNFLHNDGLVSIVSGSYAQANIAKRTECAGYNHGDMKDGKQSNCSVIGTGINKRLFDLIVDDLFATPIGSAPVVSSSLTISPNGPYSIGNTVTAKFSITNRGDAPVTFLQLAAGGRLNGDNTGAGGYPDFSFNRDITLGPGQTYNYTGTQTLNRSGNYSFFIAYQKANGTWVTNVPVDGGVSNTASLVVGSSANPTVTSSLQVTGQTCVGGVLSAKFTITNRGSAAITLTRLAAGGRLNNDNTGAGGFPDFPFANNITLNPGASFNYTGSQTLTRTGSYSFFVAYQKTDGSWVTNVPADAGVANTASANVTGTCGGDTPNPMVSASLVLSGQTCVGGVLSAKFTITNRGNAAITLSRLSAGGRLNNDNTGAGGFPDFPFANNITLNPGASFNYTGSQTLTRTGSYSFFVAYQKTDGSWVTNVPADAGVANTASANVTGTCGGDTPNPMVSASLVLSGQTCVGGVLSAKFTITNRGNAAITLSRLSAGGRLNNDNTGAGGFPDFPFANNITLNPGASFNYTGSQTLTRTGGYSFFVAYQKTDGSWVTNVPADAGVSNTASANVTGTCGGETPNPMVSASLQISGQACVGGVLSAKFTITNRGNAAITLSRLSAGGRLNNDNTGAGGFPDFPFATNITLNPGASFNYTGSQTLTRTGSYSFFVAYQKTDGSWVTNVPADAGVSNTASVSVTGACGGGGTPNPMVSGSLTISPNGPYFTGVTLTARFTITNRGNAAITFSRLGAGGRLNNDNSCSGGCPDFSFDTNVTLNAGASYSYTGTQFISRAGSYGFYVAYQKTDGTWVTNVPADAGVTNTVNINVGTQTQTIAWEFSSTGNSQGWTGNNMSATSVNSGIYFLDPSGLDPFIVSPNISASASTYQYFVVQMASNGLDSTGAVYFKTQAENFYSEDKKVLFSVSNCSLCGNAGFVRYAVFMAGNSKWTGTITGLRLDPTGKGQAGTNTDSIGIDYIRLSSSSLASNSLLEVFEHVAISNRYFYPLATPAFCQCIYGASGPDGPLACAGE